MEHIGIDLGSRKSAICIANDEAQVTAHAVVRTASLGSWLAARAPGQVVLEACSQARIIAGQAKAAGHQVFVVPAQVVRALGVGARGLKTDRRDAEVLAMASARNVELPQAWLRSDEATELGRLCSMRALLVRQRTMLVNSVKSLFRERLWRAPSRGVRDFEAHVRSIFETHEQTVPLHLEIALASITHITAQIQRLDESLVEHAKTPTQRLLRTVPGVGPITAAAFEAVVDNPHRFRHPDELASFMALVAGENTTGGKVHRTALISAGPVYLRSLLIQCAWTLMRTRPNEPMVRWCCAIMRRRGPRIAVVALARKLAIILWSVWRRGRPYDPTRAVCMDLLPPREVFAELAVSTLLSTATAPAASMTNSQHAPAPTVP